MPLEINAGKVKLFSSRKYPYPPQGRLMEIPRGGGLQKPNFVKKIMALKWNFQMGWGGGGTP